MVDDDLRALRFVRDALSGAGYAPLVTGAPHDLRRIIRAERPRLVLLDLLLPDVDGIELMRQVPELADLPVIFISAYGRDETVARALESGAADYLVKPFSPTELVARIRAALRRREAPEPFAVGDLAIDYEQRRVMVGGEPLELTLIEYELLRVLSPRGGSWRSRRCCTWCGARTRRRPSRTWCATSSGTSAASSATARPTPCTCSTSAASATAWRSRRTDEDPTVGMPRPRRAAQRQGRPGSRRKRRPSSWPVVRIQSRRLVLPVGSAVESRRLRDRPVSSSSLRTVSPRIRPAAA